MKFFSITLFLFFNMLSTLAQQNPETALYKLNQIFPKQKMYFHYDKETYFAGENIWFKAYVLNNGFPDAESRNLFVKLIDRGGNTIQEKKYPILGATVAGSFFIPDSLQEGAYTIYAFTPTILIGNTDNWYKKKLIIFQSKNLAKTKTENISTETKDTISLKFFPEGGNFITNIKSVVAFEALQENGNPIDVSFNILNETGAIIKRVSSIHDGMGKFEITPLLAQHYSVQLTNPVNKIIKCQFPKVSEQGISLHIEGLDDMKKYSITKSIRDTAVKSLRLLVHKNHQVVLNQFIYFKHNLSVEGAIATEALGSGILTFTLFDQHDLPIAERLVFVSHQEYKSPATVKWLTTGFNKRQYNEIELTFKEHTPVTASIAITDAHNINDTANRESIYSRLLLTDDIKGAVYYPAWYFTNNSDQQKEALDVLLMTHGWKHFSWNTILNNQFFKEPPKDNAYITLVGNVFAEKNNRAIKNGTISLLLTLQNNETVYESANVKEDGSFIMDSIVTWGTTKLLFTYLNTDGRAQKAIIKIKMDSLSYWMHTNDIFIPQQELKKAPINVALYKNNLSPIDYVYKETKWGNGKVYTQEAVTVKGKKNNLSPAKEVDARYAVGIFSSGQPRRLYDLINNPHPFAGLSVWDYIKNYLPVDIEDTTYATMRIVSRTQFDLETKKKWSVAVFLDENEVTEGGTMNILKTTIIQDVALIKYWATSFSGAVGNAPGGAIAIYLKKHEDRQIKTPSPVNTYTFDGYSVLEEFYSPDYSKPDKRHGNKDTRNTLYWSPNIITDKQNNKLKIGFYNNDFTTGYKIVVEGMDQNGQLIHVEDILEQTK